MTSPSRRKHPITVPAHRPAAKPTESEVGSACRAELDPARQAGPTLASRLRRGRWRSWLEAAAVAGAIAFGVQARLTADDFAPPARFLPTPEAQPIAAPTPALKLNSPQGDSGPSLGNEWTAAGRKSASPVAPQAELVNHTKPTLKPTSGNLSWRPRDASLGKGQ